MSPALSAKILRDPVKKDAVLEISTSKSWEIFAGPWPDEISLDKAVLSGNGSGNFFLPVSRKKRSYFLLFAGNEKILLAEEHLPMKGAFNFRDLGGIAGADGKYVTWGKFIRADEMNMLTKEDLAYLSSIPVTTVVDFRRNEEKEFSRDRIPESVKNLFHLAIDPGRLDPETLQKFERATTAEEMFLSMHSGMLRSEDVLSQYRKFFHLVQNPDLLPILFHCTAGKDRTGMATVLLLSALGVDYPLILENYLASNRYLAGKYGSLMEENPQLVPLFVVKAEYLSLVMESIEENYLSMENFLEDVLEVDIKRMRELYLYKNLIGDLVMESL